MPIRREAGAALVLILVVSILPISCRLLGGGVKTSAVAANKVCCECHIDFEGEELVRVHEKHQVACVRCHGRSQAHMEDEVRKTPADFTARGKGMEVFCLTCHDPVKHHRIGPHKQEAAKTDPARRRSCTQCHGEHKLVEVEAIKPK